MSVHADPPPAIVREPHGIQYATGEQLGKGGFAICHRGQVLENGKPTGRVIALKIVKADMQPAKLAVKFRTELQLHSKLRHPNIVDFHRAFSYQLNTYVVLEICDNGSLADAIKKRKYFTMPEIRRFVIQTCGAIKYLHHRNIVHRDLKTGNLFLDKDMNIKVGDFGLAALLVTKNDIGMRRTTMCGTPNYLAPEILEKSGKGHNEKVDLWSIGIIAYTLAVGKAPFHAPKREDIYKKLQARDYTWPDVAKCPNEISHDLRELVGSLLVHEDDRPSPDAIVSHPFFKMTYIPERLDSSCTSQIPTWPGIRPPSVHTMRRGYTDTWYNLCQASGVGEYEPGCTFQVCGGKRIRSVVRDVEKELAAGRGPVIPMPPNDVYVPFPGRSSFPLEEREEVQLDKLAEQENNSGATCLRETSGNGRSLPPPKRAASRSKALMEARARLEAKENMLRAAEEPGPVTLRSQSDMKTKTIQTTNMPSVSDEVIHAPTRANSSTSLRVARRAVTAARSNEAQSQDRPHLDKTTITRTAATFRTRPLRVDSANNSGDLAMHGSAGPTKDAKKLPHKDANFQISPEEVLDRASKLRDNILRALAGRPIANGRTTRRVQLPFVTTWVDYTKKYGLAYCMQDGAVGIAQRSTSSHAALFWYVRDGRSGLEMLRNGGLDEDLPMNVYEAHSKGGIRPTTLSPSSKRQGASWWGKLASYMERSRPIDLDKSVLGSVHFVIYYQRVDGVLIFGFDNGAIQLNFPDHTKIVLSPDGRFCDFTCLPDQAWPQLERHGKMSPVMLQNRTVISGQVADFLAAGATDSSDSHRAQLNHLPMKLQFVAELIEEWKVNGGLGYPDGSASRVAWRGERLERLDPKANAVIGGLGCRYGET